MDVGTERPSFVRFLGKKLGTCSVTPAVKQGAWETLTVPSGSDVCTALQQQELPGSVSNLQQEPQKMCTVHKTHLDSERHKDSQHRVRNRWAAFRQWITAGRRSSRVGQAFLRDSGEGQCNVHHGTAQQEVAGGVQFYIPYHCAEVCVAQMAKDMENMRKRHVDIVREMEEEHRLASRDQQEKTSYVIQAHFHGKLRTFKKMLGVYHQKVERRTLFWEEKIESLKNKCTTYLEEKLALQEKQQADAAKWEAEKLKMLELFSSRLDLLHKHQAFTLQELQMARLELGKVQDLLGSSDITEKPNESPAEERPESPEYFLRQSRCSGSDMTLEGAQARLETLKESLYRREREITELLHGEEEIQAAACVPCAGLLSCIISQAHKLYQDVSEVKCLLDKLAEVERGNSQAELQMAVECFRTGVVPSFSGTQDHWELQHTCYQEQKENSENPFSLERMRNVGQQLLQLQTELKQLKDDNKRIIENYNSERVMRKKYYNMVEDMKGKIRVFCRIRPLSKAEVLRGSHCVLELQDEFTLTLDTSRGLKEFQFDRVFNSSNSQEDIFQDVSRLIQSAIDGFNVCIFAYGQTGSGKTFTMVGDKEQRSPGIVPRTFRKIFDIIEENGSKFEIRVSTYILELYNERLLDLFVSPMDVSSRKIEVKKDRRGVVFPQGAETREASSAEELLALFEQACENRRIAATSMNPESSRSHLIIGVTVESRSLTSGSVSLGKLSLVDLAGSERAAKTGARDEQLKEANSINKSLSALGDVINALSSEQPHVPYRNNRLTHIMQDSLGGNAKTLMFVTVSPSSCNTEETLTSLTYATRVKAITNQAHRNSESREIAQLKEIILKLKAGQPVELEL